MKSRMITRRQKLAQEELVASGGDNFNMGDQVEKAEDGEGRTEVPRLARRKKNAAPEDVPVAEPAGDNPFVGVKAETLTKLIKALSTDEDLVNDKAVAELIADATEQLISRPPVVDEAAAPAAPANAAPAAAPAPTEEALPRAAGRKKAGPLMEKVTPVDQSLTTTGPLGALRRLLYTLDGSENKHQILGLVEKALDESPEESPAGSPVIASRRKRADGGASFISGPLTVEEGKTGEVPEIAEAHGKTDDLGRISPRVKRPAGEESIEKFATDLSLSSAVKKSEDFGEKLKALYLDAKCLTTVNETRPVRDAVEAIFHAAKAFAEASKVLNKQCQQEKFDEEAEVAKLKEKKSSRMLGFLNIASAE
jgi:hypothetical protein